MPLDVQDSVKPDFELPSVGVLVRTVVGLVLVVVGTGLGLYLAKFAYDLVAGAEPPALVGRLVGEKVRGEVELPPPNEGKASIEVSPNVMQIAAYVVTVFLLFLPAGIAKSLIGAGAGLLDTESARVTKKLLAELRNRGA